MPSDIKLYNMDCMEAMKDMPDKAFDLAIVDPPYGIGNFIPQGGKQAAGKFSNVEWNNNIPIPKYFEEVNRVSINRIIWGANYYNKFDDIGGAIVWDKCRGNPLMSKCEIASCSLHKRVEYFRYSWNGFQITRENTIHPCQKPVALYKWILKNYAKDGDRILDTHLGSGSIAIACYDMGFDLVGYEIDKDYYGAAVKRLENHKKQLQLF